MTTDLDADSLERLVPEELRSGDTTGDETLRLHLERYEFAARHVTPGRVLDLACGVGYGTRLVTDRNPEVREGLGVDVSEAAVAYARERYANERTSYTLADAMNFVDPGGFDSIVSLETIEHLPEPAPFVARLVTMLHRGGRLVASVPTTPSVDINPHHLHDFSVGSFRRLFTAHGLVEVDRLVQIQSVSIGSVLGRKEARMKEVRKGLPMYYVRHPAALGRRLWATIRHGLSNHYLTIVWQRLP